MSNTSIPIGIDLGTTYCCVGYLDENLDRVEIIANQVGGRTTPSYVAFTDNEEIIGAQARNRVFRTPENVVYDSKRLIGQQFNERYLHQGRHNWSFQVSSGVDNTPLINIPRNGTIATYTPQQISAKLLSYLKRAAEDRLGTKVKEAVITVPAYFNYRQRNATKEAAKLAGLQVLQIMNEPTAAALAYVHKNELAGQTLLIFDLGGGTLDVSVVKIKDQSITVRATSGNTNLGGRDFDNNLANLIVQKIEGQYNRIIGNDLTAMRRINKECEELKVNLTSERSTYVELSLFDNVNVDLEITRAEFEDVNLSLFTNCLQIVENCLRDARLERNEIDTILLIGGSTRVPKLQEMLEQFFDGKLLAKTIDQDEAVANGAAVQASYIKRKLAPHKVTDVTPLSLGTDLVGGIMEFVIPRNTQIPTIQTSIYYTVTDEQNIADINIFEGERSLTQYNSKIGTCIMELPPNPPGYPVEVSFYIDASGILDVSTKTEEGVYKSLAIEYGNQTTQTVKNTLKELKENKKADGNRLNAVNKWKSLRNYCTKMKAICKYARNITNEDQQAIERSCDYFSNWLETNQVINGSLEEENAIAKMQTAVEAVCEKITNNYEYHVRDMTWQEFHNFITGLNNSNC